MLGQKNNSYHKIIGFFPFKFFFDTAQMFHAGKFNNPTAYLSESLKTPKPKIYPTFLIRKKEVSSLSQ